jgi:hypothetical protein
MAGFSPMAPVEAAFDDNPRRDSAVLAVHLWNPDGEEPGTMRQVFTRLDTNQDRLVSMTTLAGSRLIPVRSVDDDIKSVCSERAIGSG